MISGEKGQESLQQSGTSQKVTKKKEKTYKKFTVDLNNAVSNHLLSLESAAKYVQNNLKVNGLKGKLGDFVKVGQTDKKDKLKNTLVVSVDSTMKFSKRYIRYLMKKFLKREGIALYLRIVSNSPSNYVVKLIRKNTEV